MGGLAAAAALSCLLGAAPQLAAAAVQLNGCAGGSFGDACSLGELVAGGSMEIDGVRFSGFGLESVAGRALDAGVIRVDPLDALGNPGFRLVDFGGALTLGGDAAHPDNDTTSSNLEYFVTAPAGGPGFRDSSLAMGVGTLAGDNSLAHVGQFVFDATQTELLGLRDAFCDTGVAPSCANALLTDAAANPHAPASALYVLTIIDVTGDQGLGGVGQLNSVTAQFATAPVPEPETYALMLAGLGLVGWAARRRDRS
jgi:hypothetical protein